MKPIISDNIGSMIRGFRQKKISLNTDKNEPDYQVIIEICWLWEWDWDARTACWKVRDRAFGRVVFLGICGSAKALPSPGRHSWTGCYGSGKVLFPQRHPVFQNRTWLLADKMRRRGDIQTRRRRILRVSLSLCLRVCWSVELIRNTETNWGNTSAKS